MNNLTVDDIAAILNSASRLKEAQIARGNADAPKLFQTIGPIDLSTASTEQNPFPVNFSFTSVRVRDVTDATVTINLRPNGPDIQNDKTVLGQNDSIVFGTQVARAVLFWAAQSGKTITLEFYTDAEFRSGKMLQINAGGVTINEGSAVGSPTQVTLVAATAAAILPIKSTRNTAIAQNNTGADIWVGDSTVTNAGATKGIRYSDGERIVWKNTAALYAYSVGGGNITTLEES